MTKAFRSNTAGPHRHVCLSALGVAASVACAQSVLGQSNDALIDKLVNKGILTVKEANELREESDKNFKQAYAVKSGLPDWVTSFKWNGDMRGRYEAFSASNPQALDRHRVQYRLRLGASVTMLDNFEVGIRLASAGDTPGNPISSNQTLDNNASKKGLALDQAYGRWTPVDNANWAATLTLGKMENPLVFAPIVFDPDYTPEGFGQHFIIHATESHDLKLNLGQFVIEERSGKLVDSYLLGGQLLWEAKWSPAWKTTAGVGALVLSGRENLTPANGIFNIGEGNTRVGGLAANAPLHNFYPIIGDASVTYTLPSFPLARGPVPLTLAGEVLHNIAAPDHNNGYSAKLTLGKAGKKGLWETSYEYRYLEADAVFEEFPESDFNAYTQIANTTGGTAGYVNGTNIRGHILRLGYSPFDAFTLAVSLWLTDNINENPAGSSASARRLQMDAQWKF